MQPNKVIKIIDYFFETYFINYSKEQEVVITFSGGECFLYFDELLYYLKHIKEYKKVCMAKITIILQTNGSLLNDEIINKLMEFENLIIYLSYDGTAQDITRQNKLKLFKTLQKLCDNHINVIVNSVFQSNTIQHIYSTFLELNNLHIKQWNIGLNFLEFIDDYDIISLQHQFDLILNDKINISIKNINHIQNANLIYDEKFLSTFGITITPYGEFIPINTDFYSTKQDHFGNDSIGLIEDVYNDYVNDQLNIIKKQKFYSHQATSKELVKNLTTALRRK